MFSLLSGGKDSITATHVLMTRGELESAVFLDTGISCHDVLPHVQQTCEKFGWPLEIYRTTANYEALVMKYGFPGKRGSHNWFMSYLKGRGVRQFKKAHPEGILASGVRLDESKRRLRQAKEWGLWEGVRVYAPILEWTTEQVWKYVRQNKLPISPAYETLHISGDCLCGAFADPNELELMRSFYPDEHKRIVELETHRASISCKDCKWGGLSYCSDGQCGL